MPPRLFQPAPILFEPILKERVWGGRELEKLGKTLPPAPGARIGESWELADLPDGVPNGRSIIRSGFLVGMTLREAISDHPREIMGQAKLGPEGGFPLLIKYLDARQNLSVQVHPDERYVKAHPEREAHLKSEAWYVVRAEPSAVIYKGIRGGVTRAEFLRHVESGEVVADLIAVPVRAGDCHYLPSGTCHALGAGTVVAEVQTPSDTTFRVYDWGRGRSETGRELHIAEALECIDFDATPQVSQPSPPPYRTGGLITTPLVRTRYFRIEKMEVCADWHDSAGGDAHGLEIVTSGMPAVWMIVAGAAQVQTPDGHVVDLPLGTTALMPAAMRGAVARLARGAAILRISVPPPTEGLIA